MLLPTECGTETEVGDGGADFNTLHSDSKLMLIWYISLLLDWHKKIILQKGTTDNVKIHVVE